ncbi:MAG: protein-tyrosine-phosphatase [Bacteroidetes bacterium]|nr:MAG: protein-tyrosine-phosphatase [Bacteroidota bacterium]
MQLYPELKKVIDHARNQEITPARKNELHVLIDYLLVKRKSGQELRLQFICTHNSRRSQFCQAWAHVAAAIHEVDAQIYSGGTEVTECHPNTIQSLLRMGFQVTVSDSPYENPVYKVRFSKEKKALYLHSKTFDDPKNPNHSFAAIMTCSDADENCPFIPGCEVRIPLRYEDPKAFDHSPLDLAMYDLCSLQVASEMLYVFSKLSHSNSPKS